MVEFALLLPVFWMMVLGMVTGGIAYNRKLSLSHAAREGARYGAVIPNEGVTAPSWTSQVRAVVVDRASNDLNLSTSTHWLCVALVDADGTVKMDSQATPQPFILRVGPVPASYTTNCSTTTAATDSSRVNVAIGRPDKLQFMVASMNLNLTGAGAARYER